MNTWYGIVRCAYDMKREHITARRMFMSSEVARRYRHFEQVQVHLAEKNLLFYVSSRYTSITIILIPFLTNFVFHLGRL